MGALPALLRAVPVWVWAFAAVLAWGAFQKHSATRATRAAEQAAAAASAHAAAAKAERAQRDIEQQAQDRARRAADAYATTITQARRAASAAGAERDRLRDAIAASGGACAPSSGASAAGRVDAAAGLRRVLGECASALSAVAEAADADAAKLSGLQAYVRAVVPAASGAQ